MTEDVIALAKQYNANGADELLVFDLSDSDEDHEESIDLIKKTKPDHQYSDGCGRKLYEEQRMLKKLLYAGVKRAMLNFSKKCFHRFN